MVLISAAGKEVPSEQELEEHQHLEWFSMFLWALGMCPSWPGWEAPWDTLSGGSLPVSLSHSFPVSVPSELSVASFKLGPGSQWEKGAWACPSLNPMSE